MCLFLAVVGVPYNQFLSRGFSTYIIPFVIKKKHFPDEKLEVITCDVLFKTLTVIQFFLIIKQKRK